MAVGWVSIHRKIMEKHDYFSEPFCRNMAWVDMILLANHEKNFFRCRGVRVEVKRGQIGYGLDKLGERWKWSRGKVERFMKELEQDKQVVRQKNNVTTLISIVNYSQYQETDKADDNANKKADNKTDRHQTVKQTDVNNNDNNDNNENKVGTADQFWFLKFYHSDYENYKKVFNGQSTTESNFLLWKQFIDFIYLKKYEELFECKFLNPHDFARLVEKENFTKENWEAPLKKILATGVESKHNLFFRIPEFMKYGKTKEPEKPQDVKIKLK